MPVARQWSGNDRLCATWQESCRHRLAPKLEDDLIACSAKRNDVDVIVTRNKRDFAKSPVPALTPEEFVSAYKPVDMEYELVEF